MVPDRKILRDKNKMLPTDKPGIITETIEDISRNEPDQILTYKLCVDGKKINPNSKGKVDLWGYKGESSWLCILKGMTLRLKRVIMLQVI